MTFAFHLIPDPTNDFSSIRSNGMWYQSWQSGFDDILKRGFPRPTNPETVLAELYSPVVPSFMHGGTGGVPFLVTNEARQILEGSELTGFHFAPVIVAKIATLGKRKREGTGRSEPEDQILKSKGVPLELAPELFAVCVDATVEVTPDFPAGRHPSGNVSPFEVSGGLTNADFWRPSVNGKTFSAWSFCSPRFRAVCESNSLSNVKFVAFLDFMSNFRASCERQ
mgnify:FL=1